MTFDLILRNARLAAQGGWRLIDIAAAGDASPP
jgi:hypothetical protein